MFLKDIKYIHGVACLETYLGFMSAQLTEYRYLNQLYLHKIRHFIWFIKIYAE